MYKLNVLGETIEVEEGTTYAQLAARYQDRFSTPIAAAAINGKIRELFKRVIKDGEVKFYTLSDDVGHLTYVRTATMLTLKAICDVFGEAAANKSRVDFTIGNGLFINPEGALEPSEDAAAKIKARMLEIVAAGTPFMKKSYPLDEAYQIFEAHGMQDKLDLFKFRRTSQVNVYEIDGYYDYY